MWWWIANNQVKKGFEHISRGDFEPVLKLFASDVHFTFAGEHALGADVHIQQGARDWFARVHRIFPGLKIEAKRIFVAGLPWDMIVTTQFHVSDTLPDGTRYDNHGVQILRIRFGKIVEDHLLEDNLILTDALQRLSKLGIAEASASPFVA